MLLRLAILLLASLLRLRARLLPFCCLLRNLGAPAPHSWVLLVLLRRHGTAAQGREDKLLAGGECSLCGQFEQGGGCSTCVVFQNGRLWKIAWLQGWRFLF